MNGATTESYSVDSRLVERIRQGKCILFVGPQASRADPGYLGPPGPATLVAELADRLRERPLTPGDLTLPRIAQLYQEDDRKKELLDVVRGLMVNPAYQPTLIHHLIAELPIDFIVSTSFDSLLYDLLKKKKPEVRCVLDPQELDVAGGAQLIKLFGTVEREPRPRISETDLEELFEDESETSLVTKLKVASASSFRLFVGFYLDQELFRKLYWEFYGRAGSDARPALALQSPEEPPISWGESLNLIPTRIEPSLYLAELVRVLAEAEGRTPPKVAKPAQPKRLNQQERVRRAQIFNGVLARIGLGGPEVADGRIYDTGRIFPAVQYAHQLQVEQPQIFEGEIESSPAIEARLLLAYGSAEWAEDNYEQARIHFERASTLDPMLLEAHLSLHYLLTEIGELKSAFEKYQEAAKLDRDRTAGPVRMLLPSRYEIQAVLGMSDLGIAYMAKDNHLVSVTVLRRAVSGNLAALNQFAQARAKLKHPRVAPFIRLGEHRGRFYVVHEYVAGKTLDRWLEQDPSFREVIGALDQVAETLEFAHKQDLPHLSLNPRNILVSEKGEVTLVNFREMDLLSDTAHATLQGVQAYDYLAPEQQAGKLGDERSDIYAFGTIVNSKLKSGSDDEALEVFCAKARQVDPARRFDDVRQMRQEFGRVVGLPQPGKGSALIQPLYRLLSWLSEAWKNLNSHANAFVAYLLLLLVAGIGVESFSTPPPARTALRLLLLLTANFVPVSLLCNWRVRLMARTTGFGSLIRSSHGMGLLFGTLMTLWHLENVTKECNPVSIGALPTAQFVPFGIVAAIFTFASTFVMLSIVHSLGRMGQQRWNSYLGAFYGSFLLLSLLVLLFTAVPVYQFTGGQGFLEVSGCPTAQ